MTLNGSPKKEKMHRVIAKVFIPNPDNLPQVNHKNGLKWDNRVCNLEWVSNLHNQRHAWDTDLKTVKLTNKDVEIIKSRIIEGHSNCDIAPDFNVDVSTISNIRRGRTWNRTKQEEKDEK